MSLTTCKINIAQKTGRVVYATLSLLKSLGLKKSTHIALQFGNKSLAANLKIMKRQGSQLFISPSIARQLNIPGAFSCTMVSQRPGEIRIGPIIGILTYASKSLDPPFGNRTPLISHLFKAGDQQACVIAFSPRDVNWQKETVYGYLPKQGGGWEKRTFPLPDVVYNRLPSRRAEKSLSIEAFKERFIQRDIPLFNWSFFDKSEVNRLLERDPTEKYMPESYNSPSREDIQYILQKHRFAYLKPTSGSLGIGIYRLTYHKKRGYFARFRQNGKNILLRFNKFNGLIQHLQRRNINLSNYVIQQGIRLIEYDQRPIDFRFHLTKNDKNEWDITGIGAKKGGKGSVTTHIRSGGQLMTPEYALEAVFGNRSKTVLESAKSAVIQLAEAIEKNYKRLLGELGFDIGIDVNENIWMFEANSKPGRSIFKHPALKSEGLAAIHNIISFSHYLSGFQDGGDTP